MAIRATNYSLDPVAPKGAPFGATRLQIAVPFILHTVNGRLQHVKRPLSYLNHRFAERSITRFSKCLVALQEALLSGVGSVR